MTGFGKLLIVLLPLQKSLDKLGLDFHQVWPVKPEQHQIPESGHKAGSVAEHCLWVSKEGPRLE